MKFWKEIKVMVVILGVVGLCMFFVIFFQGLRNVGQPELSGEIFSDNWFLTPHPILFGCCALALLYIFVPVFFRKKT